MLELVSLDFQISDVACRLVTVNPSNQSDPHLHRHFQHSHSGCEIHYVSSGTLTMDCIGESYPLSAGQMMLVPPGLYHYVRSTSGDVDRMDMLLEVNHGYRSNHSQLDRFLQGLHMAHPLILLEENNPELFALLRKIRQGVTEKQHPDFLRQEWLKVMCTELVLLMGTAAASCTQSVNTPFDRPPANTDRYIMDQFFNHNYHGNSDMAALAKELNLSIRQTGRILQKTYGKSFREKMNECRLAVALDQLCNTAKPMAEISELLGYGEPTNFSSFIKRQTGKTPAQIRKENKQNRNI